MPRNACIVAALRLPVGKTGGAYRDVRPDDLLACVLRRAVERCPGLDPATIDDVIVGCAMPEAEQGLNVARMGVLLAGLPQRIPGVTVNRFCASGAEAIAIAAQRIAGGEADVIIAAGVESMSRIPMGGHAPRINPRVFENADVAMAYGMGITAENVARDHRVSRSDQDAYALESHRRALAAMAGGAYADEIVPYVHDRRTPDLERGEVTRTRVVVERDEGPRADTSLDALAKLRPAFADGGSVTAGNSSQMSDGAAALVLMSEDAAQRCGLAPLARYLSYAVTGVAPAVMGIGPVTAIPLALRRAGLSLDDIDWIELNEAFAAQTLAVMRELRLDPAKVNPLGGAIALGHPLGATGVIRAATLVHGLRRRGLRYGLVTMCVGTGMGAALCLENVRRDG